jgi:predicted O-linked N-acetylglucosamine transferase (SPINDLY family)
MSPAQAQRLLQEGIGHHRAGRLAQAETLYRRVRLMHPKDFDALHLCGIVALQQNRVAESVDLLGKAHAAAPRNVPCALRYGLALISGGRPVEAEPVLRAALELEPKSAEGWDHLAYCLKLQDKLSAALECHQKAVTLKPDFATGWYNCGLTLSLTGRYADALRCHERAIAANPDYAKGYYGRAQALHQLHRMAEAVAAYERFLEFDPSSHEARGYRLFALNHLDHVDRDRLFAEHVKYGEAVGGPAVPEFPNDAAPDRRLRVAILSPDLRAHSCAYFLEPLLRHLDPAQFELYLYHDHFREDAVSARLKFFAAVWRNFIGQPAVAVEAAIRADRPDVLIDLAGHTGIMSRLPLFAKHLAPVQINYLGYPNTTGLPAIQYRLTDGVVDPVGEADRFATEKLVRFAPTAWAYDPPPAAPAVGVAPRLANGHVTFGCFNNIAKISDTTLGLWAQVLAAVPGSKLLLKGRGMTEVAARQRHLGRCYAAGIAADRIELIERTATTEDHLAVYSRMDISLDTFPYHGTTTTCEALWMGVPVVTLMGDRHVARVSGSLLAAIGRCEWVAQTPGDYVRIAAELASDPAKLSAIRASLREEVRNSPLGDHAGQSARFAAALRECWQKWCATRTPARAVA